MPKVASKLSFSQSPTAWMQPRTWMTSRSSKRWRKSGEEEPKGSRELGEGRSELVMREKCLRVRGEEAEGTGRGIKQPASAPVGCH